jgi:hypothetical protein
VVEITTVLSMSIKIKKEQEKEKIEQKTKITINGLKKKSFNQRNKKSQNLQKY